MRKFSWSKNHPMEFVKVAVVSRGLGLPVLAAMALVAPSLGVQTMGSVSEPMAGKDKKRVGLSNNFWLLSAEGYTPKN